MILLRVSELVGYDSHGRAEKAEPDIAFSCICSNEFKILISFSLIISATPQKGYVLASL